MKLKTPAISKALLTTKDFQAILDDEDYMLGDCEISQSDFSNETLDRAHLHNAVIKNSTFIHTNFSGIDIVDVRFINCDFSNADLSKASIHRVEFENCKLLGINFPESSLGNVLFSNSILNFATFHSSKLEKLFSNAVLQKVLTFMTAP